VVTEYGIVNLKGKSTWERAQALVSIAHPDFREELTEKAKMMNIQM
jgi:acyl-CoA hydrolase